MITAHHSAQKYTMAPSTAALRASSFAPGREALLSARRSLSTPATVRSVRTNAVVASVEQRIALKGELLEEIKGTARGLKADAAKRDAIDNVASRCVHHLPVSCYPAVDLIHFSGPVEGPCAGAADPLI